MLHFPQSLVFRYFYIPILTFLRMVLWNTLPLFRSIKVCIAGNYTNIQHEDSKQSFETKNTIDLGGARHNYFELEPHLGQFYYFKYSF